MAAKLLKEELLQTVAKHRLTYPIKHGARVQINPAELNSLDLPFSESPSLAAYEE
jgi:hypothetical protein